MLCPLDEAVKRGMLPGGPAAIVDPRAIAAIAPVLVAINENGEKKNYVRISMVYSCRSCQKELEKALAKAPSWCIVEINRGPDPTNRVSVGAE